MYYDIEYAPEDEPYIKMVYKIAHEYATNARVDFEDYVSVGLAALYKARETYEEGTNAKFSTYAHSVIENAIKKEWQENANMLSCSAYHAKNTDGAADEIRFQNATALSLDVSKRLTNPADDDKPKASGAAHKEKPVKPVILASGTDDPEEAAQKDEIIQKVDAIIEEFDKEDRDIIYRRVFAGETFQHIADAKKMSWRAVNYRFKKLQDKLKTKFSKAGLNIYASRD
jgi:RNA polymerase sigma factor (sigma-70 family)